MWVLFISVYLYVYLPHLSNLEALPELCSSKDLTQINIITAPYSYLVVTRYFTY